MLGGYTWGRSSVEYVESSLTLSLRMCGINGSGRYQGIAIFEHCDVDVSNRDAVALAAMPARDARHGRARVPAMSPVTGTGTVSVTVTAMLRLDAPITTITTSSSATTVPDRTPTGRAHSGRRAARLPQAIQVRRR